MSRFTMEESMYEGHPVIEILKDGDSFWYDHQGYKKNSDSD